MKVALLQYWLVKMGGGEKVLAAFGEMYPKADLFTHAYWPKGVTGFEKFKVTESAGLTPLEAMAQKVPCIIADLTAAAEYVEDGKTGLLFKSGDVGDLTRKIEMMKDPAFRERMSENIRRHFDLSKWSEESHAAKLLAAYREALEK